MRDANDQRPPVVVGHVRLDVADVADVGATARRLETVGLRPVATTGHRFLPRRRQADLNAR